MVTPSVTPREEKERIAEMGRAKDQVLEAMIKVDRTYEEIDEHIPYGTAGFRSSVNKMTRVCFRGALVVAMRAKVVGSMGIMVTGSSHVSQINGLKVIDADGE